LNGGCLAGPIGAQKPQNLALTGFNIAFAAPTAPGAPVGAGAPPPLAEICGDGIDNNSALKIIAEIGIDMSRWKSAKHFASWLGLCPGTKVSGGKVLSAKSKPVANRAAATLRMAAFTLFRSKSALGAYLRRQRSRLGAPKAITATAHKLARLVYTMLKHGTAYVDAGQEYYEERYRTRVVQNLKRKAQELGFSLVEIAGLQPQNATS